MSMMRSLMRDVAHTNMRREGFVQINKKHRDSNSVFADMWREFVIPGRTVLRKASKEKKKRRLFAGLFNRRRATV